MTGPAQTRASRYDVDRLLDVAARVFAERGYDGTSMEQLAAAAGITKSSIYHHVSGKEELLARSLDRALDGIFAVLDDAALDEADPVAALASVLRGSCLVLVAELPHVRLLLRVRGNTATERSALARRREFDQRVTALVAAAQNVGSVRGGVDAAMTARLLFGLVNSVSEWIHPGGDGDGDQVADAVVALALHGLLEPPCAPANFAPAAYQAR
ncbi:MAG: TetR/AcrR family transcriptional regulator [Sporichthyaceae bacterium]